ncbi:MAG TPA: bifunctional D-glycero-beta-D-manno-heptose-7-phosphate kinase/D-glycero-beta-D-manno-heptose 1-phosphate adenylyltransferase HldE [Candidatus Saccharimonadales bacterium]|jgi:D-beta-D-heptose 7-phosphate kinase/D-beta-D-heptose 1-phosphate adenosyltransferase|nr:bifunctional D-glycero-beta-D-manno-heptose-7-phosphate kinase/D-glycero-beta-D-manno-heptose 1-phosphate adenylyltransferase HldE [Candidatus Saccharimonadales bacterium]
MISYPNRAIELLEHFWDGRKILVVGDVMLDKYVWGTVERISPEAPVPVVHGTHITHCPGGAANVAMNITGLGAKAIVIGLVGEDMDGEQLESDLHAAGVETLFVPVKDIPTTSKLRVLSKNQQMLRLDFEKKGCPNAAVYEQLIRQARDAISSCSAVILSDYAKGALNERECAAIIDDARTLGIPVLVDPKSATFHKYRNATTICPNLKEMSLVAGTLPEDLDTLLDKAERYLEECGLDFLTITLGEKGITVVQKNARLHAPVVARQVLDVSGAGDTVIATLAICLACKLEIGDAIRLANAAAGIVVGKAGTVPVDRNELMGAISTDIALHAEEKILSRERLLGRVAGWRAAGQRIVFTNGCYDLLHIGHINLIEQARQQGDRLVIALNSDDSVKRLKGPGRPMVGQQERARVLAALSASDAIVIFDESTPLELIQAIRPDILVKGGDYADEIVVGASEVRSWGGRLCLVPLVEGFSTTKLIAMAARAGS